MPKIFFSLLVILCLNALPASATEFVEHENVKARLMPSQHEGAHAVIEIILSEGWHTYGDPPGDAGLPPRFDWEKSENLQEVTLALPPTTPKTEMGEFTVNAYLEEVTIPVEIERDDTQEDTILNLGLGLMICKDICIPENFELSLTLPPEGMH